MINQLVCEHRIDEGLRTFKDGVCGTIRTIDAGGCKRVIEYKEDKQGFLYVPGIMDKSEPGKPEDFSNCGYRIRKLTPKECWRLMAFSDEDFDKAQAAGVSNSQLYKQAGNSIVVDVLYYIFKNLYQAMPYLFENLKVGSYFSGIGAFEKALDKLYQNINSENSTNPLTE